MLIQGMCAGENPRVRFMWSCPRRVATPPERSDSGRAPSRRSVMAEGGFESVVLVDSNDLVVTQERLPVGGFEEAHTHTVPFLLIAISGDRGEVCDADGNKLAEIDYNVFAPGFMAYIGPDLLPTTHGLRNTGTEPIVVIQVDLLNMAGADAPSLLAPGAALRVDGE